MCVRKSLGKIGVTFVIDDYPDVPSEQRNNIFPTAVAFLEDENQKPEVLIGWQALAKREDPRWNVYQHFKRVFPDGSATPTGDSEGIRKSARDLYVKFLKGLLELIIKFYDENKPAHLERFDWDEANVMFIFSIPAAGGPSWREKAEERLIEFAEEAGFASTSKRHRIASYTPTEGHASAMYALQNMSFFKERANCQLITADVGSGTSVSTK